jgi:hypothetical protein
MKTTRFESEAEHRKICDLPGEPTGRRKGGEDAGPFLQEPAAWFIARYECANGHWWEVEIG